MTGKRFIWPEHSLSRHIEAHRNKKGTELTLSLFRTAFLPRLVRRWILRIRIGNRLVRIRTLPRSLSRQVGDFQRLLQRKIESCFRRDLHLLPFGEDLHTCAGSPAHRCTDRRSFSASAHRSNQRAEGRSASDCLRGALPARSAGLLHVAAGYVISLSLKDDAAQLQSELAPAGHPARRAGTDQLD